MDFESTFLLALGGVGSICTAIALFCRKPNAREDKMWRIAKLRVGYDPEETWELVP